ncbi:MAG: mannosyltransferase family protein [Solirubrobacteraceae bacterium]
MTVVITPALLREGPPAQAQPRRVLWRAFWGSRLIVFLTGVVAVAQFGNQPVTGVYDPNRLTAPFGYFANLLVSPFARWDSAWYLAVAKWGYGAQRSGVPLNPSQPLARMNFFPLYPMLIHGLGWVLRSDLLAGVVISLAAFAVALALLHRLVVLDFGAEVAEAAVLLLAFCPMAFYLSAVYTESLFLALALGAFYAARRGRWFWAGLLGALAAATRVEGVLLVIPLVMLARWRRDRPDGTGRAWSLSPSAWRVPPASVLWVALVPVGLLAYVVYLALSYGQGLAPFHAQSLFWMHKQTWPFGAVWKGAVAAFHGLEQLTQGPTMPYHVALYAGGPVFSGMQDIYLFLFLVVIVVAFLAGLRRLPPAYSAYTLLSLALPLSDPVVPSPLGSIPRYAMVAFPLFIWGAQVVVRRHLTVTVVAVGAVLLGLFTAEFATWVWVG